MTNAKLDKFTSNCKQALEDLGIEIEETASDAKVRKTLADASPSTFVAVRSNSGIELADVVGR